MKPTPLIALAALALLTACDKPQDFPMPPADQRAGKGTTIVTTSDPTSVAKACKKPARACAYSESKLIFMPDPCEHRREYYAAMFCHELSHVFGGYKDPPPK